MENLTKPDQPGLSSSICCISMLSMLCAYEYTCPRHNESTGNFKAVFWPGWQPLSLHYNSLHASHSIHPGKAQQSFSTSSGLIWCRLTMLMQLNSFSKTKESYTSPNTTSHQL